MSDQRHTVKVSIPSGEAQDRFIEAIRRRATESLRLELDELRSKLVEAQAQISNLEIENLRLTEHSDEWRNRIVEIGQEQDSGQRLDRFDLLAYVAGGGKLDESTLDQNKELPTP